MMKNPLLWALVVAVVVLAFNDYFNRQKIQDLDYRSRATLKKIQEHRTDTEALMKESQARQKISALILDMDKKAAEQCTHEGPKFIAEDGSGTYCITCGAHLKK